MNTVVPMPISFILVCLLAQVPNPTPAINAAKDAKAQTEAAQQKNAEALAPGAPASPQRPQGAEAGQPASPAPGQPAAAAPQAGAQQQPPPPQGAGYSYDPSGRRDPFVSLASRGGDVAPPPGARPAGVSGLLVNEMTVKGVWKSSRGGFIALVQSPDNRTYIVKAGDKVFDGTVKQITQDAVVFSQDVNDPLSLVKQREIRKQIRPEAR
jgi:Tfp pilus assembly protein PilP